MPLFHLFNLTSPPLSLTSLHFFPPQGLYVWCPCQFFLFYLHHLNPSSLSILYYKVTFSVRPSLYKKDTLPPVCPTSLSIAPITNILCILSIYPIYTVSLLVLECRLHESRFFLSLFTAVSPEPGTQLHEFCSLHCLLSREMSGWLTESVRAEAFIVDPQIFVKLLFSNKHCNRLQYTKANK